MAVLKFQRVRFLAVYGAINVHFQDILCLDRFQMVDQLHQIAG